MFFGSAMVDHTSEKLKHVAFSVIIAVAVLTALGSVIISSVSTEGFEINEVTLKKGSGTEAVLLVSVKNLGNSQIDNILVTIDGLTASSAAAATATATTTATATNSGAIIRVNGAAPHVAGVAITGITYLVQFGVLDVGKIASIAVNIQDSKSMLAGSSYTITVEAETPDDTKTFQTAVVHVTRI